MGKNRFIYIYDFIYLFIYLFMSLLSFVITDSFFYLKYNFKNAKLSDLLPHDIKHC